VTANSTPTWLFSEEFHVTFLLCHCVVKYPEHNQTQAYYHKNKKNGYSSPDCE
jgi:hypothetical protein